MRFNRQELVSVLSLVSAGISSRENLEQSSCIVSKNKKLFTFNDTIACRVPFDLGFEGAITAKQLTEALDKLTEDDLEMEFRNNALFIKPSKARKIKIPCENTIKLPIDLVERPTKWKRLHPDFIEALQVVEPCASRDKEEKFIFTCIHIHPEYVEACDNMQACRYPLPTGFEYDCIVRSYALKNVATFLMTEFSEGKNWLHFRNGTGLIMSIRRDVETYPDLGVLIDSEEKKQHKIILPGGLADAVEKASIFADETLLVSVSKGLMQITGQGHHGYYKERKRAEYNGPPLTFKIMPKMLVELSKRNTECMLTARKLYVLGSRFKYFTCLERVKDVG